MREARLRLATIAVVIFVGRALAGCGAPTPVRRFDPADGSTVTEDDSGPGGAQPGTGGALATGGAPETGGAGGGGTGGPGVSSTGGTSGESPDASVESTGGAPGSGGTGGSATGGSGPATGGSGPATGGSTGSVDAGSAGPEVGHAVPATGTAACFTDPNVIAICKQLEPACSNCPDTSILNDCYDVAAAGNDRACARYAVDHKCTVDVGGNTCGSLNCRATGCNRTACTDAQGEGDTNVCQTLLATCPCK